MVVMNAHKLPIERDSAVEFVFARKYFLIDDQPSCGSSLKTAMELLIKLPPLLFFSILFV